MSIRQLSCAGDTPDDPDILFKDYTKSKEVDCHKYPVDLLIPDYGFGIALSVKDVRDIHKFFGQTLARLSDERTKILNKNLVGKLDE